MESQVEIFVFGSNLAGKHGAGSAKYARENYGAIYGIGVGPQGESYAIPTKDRNLNVLPLDHIKLYVDEFIYFAKRSPNAKFRVTKIGCGLAGYTPEQIAPMFKGCPENVTLPKEFINIINEDIKRN